MNIFSVCINLLPSKILLAIIIVIFFNASCRMGKPKRLRSNPKLPAREIKPPSGPSKLCQWSDLSMQEAIKAVHEGKMSINRAAMEHTIPPTTLKDCLSGRVKHGTKPNCRYDITVMLLYCSVVALCSFKQHLERQVQKTVEIW